MKINWGTGLVIVMALFIGFIAFFVIKMSTDKKYAHDLVTEDYYKKEMTFQKEIDAQENAITLKTNVTGKRSNGGWVLHFPEELNPSKIKGKVFLYRPSNKQLDFEIPIVLTKSNLLIPDKRLLEGRWNITVDWEYEETKYLFKQSIHY